jgi:hypothetical protein
MTRALIGRFLGVMSFRDPQHCGLWQHGACGFIVGLPWTCSRSPKHITSAGGPKDPLFFKHQPPHHG